MLLLNMHALQGLSDTMTCAIYTTSFEGYQCGVSPSGIPLPACQTLCAGAAGQLLAGHGHARPACYASSRWLNSSLPWEVIT